MSESLPSAEKDAVDPDAFGAAGYLLRPPAEKGTPNPYADVHSVLCHSAHRPHDHGFACHSTCPTCGGQTYILPPGNGDES